ncbi:MAG: PepSY domain-containing protein [Elusimicrobiales bacterium]|nr:PepSY domain-containing protein [Elusimicrobiales bacterium]
MRKFLLFTAALLLLAGDWQLHAASKKISPLSDSIRKVRKTPSFTTREAFRKFSLRHGKGWKVRYSPRTALPEAITGGSTTRYPGTPEQAAQAFFADNKELLKVDPLSLTLVNKREFMGITHLQYQQYKDGLPVEFSYARVHVAKDGSVTGYQGKFEPDVPTNLAPAITPEAAVNAAAADLGRALSVSRTELVIFPDEENGGRKLAWKVRGRSNGLWVYYVDAATGAILLKYDALPRACPGYTGAVGSSSGTVYAISPVPTDPNSIYLSENSWTAPENLALRDQYVWVNSYSSSTVTNQYGDYCTNQAGKVFSSLKGPYFAVTNFRGESAHWDNAPGAEWVTASTPLQSQHPYDNSQNYTFPVTLTDTWTGLGKTFAKAMPHFTSFQAGELDIFGSMNDGDQMYVLSGGLTGANTVGAYTGLRRNPFYGAAVESPNFTVSLKTDASGTYNGFVMDNTKVLLLPVDHATTSNPTGSVVWAPGQSRVTMDTVLGTANALSEVNAFYHLNKVRRYFDAVNIDPNTGIPPADLSRRVAVMVHAHGDADVVGGACGTGCGGMLNAYYDLENDNILLGDGPLDPYGKYRSFALDGTIVRHEYIHLVINRIYPIVNYGEFGAISEGLSDYFALASFWSEGRTLSILGNYIGAGEGSARDISGAAPTGVRVMPTDWWGEVHEDSLPLSQALYSLRTGGTRSIGTFGSGAYNGQRRADVLAYAALFYFPDTFANYKEAMLDACRQFNANPGLYGTCDASVQAGINTAFAEHGIGTSAGGDAYEISDTAALCDSNNGPECAAEIANESSISATVYPLGDVDYYSLPLAAGNFTAKLTLPAGSQDGTYNAYSLFLFDANRDYLGEAVPVIYNTGDGYCPDSGDCLTLLPTITFSYQIERAGRYYLVVAAAPNQYYGNSEANSLLPYTLTLTRSPAGSAAARLYAASFDNDQISFDAPYTLFPALSAPSSTTLTGAELVYEYAQLRDHNYDPLDLTRTNLTGSYMSDIPTARNFYTDSFGTRIVSGRVQLKPGFAARYPGAGTIYLELFGRNHLGHIVSLGVSNAVNLSANGAEAVAYNNIITADNGAAIIKYAVTSPGSLSIKVYTQSGSLVKTVFNGPVQAGKGTVDWDGRNSDGGKVVSGIYFIKTKGPGLDKIVKVAVVR